MRPFSVLIRADSGDYLGTGHVMRCLALAYGLREVGAVVTFASHSSREVIVRRIEDAGFKVLPVSNPHPHPEDLDSTLLWVRTHAKTSGGVPWVVLDGYHFDESYQAALREEGCHVLVVDDMAHLPWYHADVIVNQNIHALPGMYRHDATTLLLGTRYALLRPEFLRWRARRLAPRREVRRIFVSLGGADPGNETRKVLEAVAAIPDPRVRATFVVGPHYEHVTELRKAAQAFGPRFSVLENVQDMARVMLDADVAVCAAGSTVWELAFMGIPMVCLILSENQRAVAEGLEHSGAAINLGWSRSTTAESIAESLARLIDSPEERCALARKARALVDGRGARRVALAMWHLQNDRRKE